MLRACNSSLLWRLFVPVGTSLCVATFAGPDVGEPLPVGGVAVSVSDPASDPTFETSDPTFEKVVRPLIQRYCVACHGEDEQRGDVRLDRLDPDLVNGPDRELFELILEMVDTGEMPSRKAERHPTTEERRIVVDWISEALIEADRELARGPALRRLSRDQYTHALRELLGLGIDFGRRLPPDARSELGFTSDGEALSTSALRLESFRSIARMALDQAIVRGERPEPFGLRVEFGRGLGRGEGNTRTGGYQSVPLDPADFRITSLGSDASEARMRFLKERTTVGLRGSSLDRFHVVDEGVVLYSALPHREVAPTSWQGPSPNLKLEMKRLLPERGDFLLRVTASRGVLAEGGRELLLAASSIGSDDPSVVTLRPTSDGDRASDAPTTLSDWFLSGPYRTESGEEANERRFVPEGPLDFAVAGPDGESLWTRAPGLDGRIRRYPEFVGAVVLGRVIEAPSPRTMELSIGSDDAVFVELNGEPVLSADVRRGVAEDQDRVSLRLREGRNDLLVKVVNHGGGFGSYVDVLHDGTRVSRAPVEPEVDHDDSIEVPSAIVVHADRAESTSNLSIDGGVLRPDVLPDESAARFRQFVPGGLWRFDLVHPVPEPNQMASIGFRIDAMRLDQRPEFDDEQREAGFAVTPIGVARLHEGLHDFLVGGLFFTGFSHLVMTPLASDHPIAARLDAEEEARATATVPELRAFIGTRTDDGMDYRCFGRVQEVPSRFGDLREFEFRGRLEDLPIPEPESGDTEILSGYCVLGVWNDHLVKSADESGPPLLIRSMEVVAPFFEQWPPQSHRALLGELELETVDPAAEVLVVRQTLERFLPRAFRRPIAQGEVERFVAFFEVERASGEDFVDSLRETLAAVLSAPSFLYLCEGDDAAVDVARIDEFALANRLSFFLWDGPPDDRLFGLAADGRLRDSLESEVERMLQDDRSARFVRRFVHEWLRMDRFEGVTIDPGLFPDFTRFVKEDMAEEPWRFVRHMLLGNRSALELIETDTALLNQNLAEFYGIEGVAGSEFRPVQLEPGSGRGGLLAHGAFLAGHSDGQEPHPIKRAVFVKERLLGQRPPAPPPNVPDLDPTIEGFDRMTLKERIERHRDHPSCMECHAGFDPFGIALETYDAVGRIQTERKGRPVDASTVLPDGTAVDGAEGLRAYLTGPGADRFVEAFVETLFGYALGREARPIDRRAIESIVERAHEDGLGLRSIVHSIVDSESFRDR